MSITKSIQTTTALGGSEIYASAVYKNFFIVAGANGRVASFDGTLWKNYDGSGLGLGPYSNGGGCRDKHNK